MLDDTISTDETRTRFLLWTRQNPSSYQELMFEDLQSVVDSNFNASLKTKVLVHGYTGDGDQSWVIRMKSGFLEKGKSFKGISRAASKYLFCSYT